MSKDEGRERARAAFAQAAAGGADVGGLLAELERGWARQDKPEEKTTIGEITGGTWWTVPWGLWRDESGQGWANPGYFAWGDGIGTAKVKLEYRNGTIHAYVPAGVKLGTPWRDAQPVMLHDDTEESIR